MTAATLGPVPPLLAWGDFPRSRYPRYDADVSVGWLADGAGFLGVAELRPEGAFACRVGEVLPGPRAAVGRM